MSSKQLLPLSGVLSVLIIIAAFITGGETPEADDSLAEVVSYYHDHDTALEIASGLLAVGGFFFLVFTTAIGLTLRRDQDELQGQHDPQRRRRNRLRGRSDALRRLQLRRRRNGRRRRPDRDPVVQRAQRRHVLHRRGRHRSVPDRNRDRVPEVGRAPEMARLGRDRDRSRGDNPRRVLRLPRARGLDAWWPASCWRCARATPGEAPRRHRPPDPGRPQTSPRTMQVEVPDASTLPLSAAVTTASEVA